LRLSVHLHAVVLRNVSHCLVGLVKGSGYPGPSEAQRCAASMVRCGA
jgi:hypothetical protein